MKLRKYCVGLVCALSVAVVAGRGHSQEQDKDKAMEEMMAAWAKANAPGEFHGHLGSMVGHWNYTSKYRPTPDGPWSESAGTSEIRWAMDKRFVIETVKGDMNGTPWEGMAVTGYDNTRKKYTSTWIDSMSTAIMISYGTVDDSRKVFTFTGTYDDPITGQMDKPTKTILRLINENKHVTEMYDKDEKGEWYMNLEVVYTRR
jgi:hypothetical protein